MAAVQGDGNDVDFEIAGPEANYRLNIHDIFDNWDSFKDRMEDWSVAGRFSWKKQRQDRQRAHYTCKNAPVTGCQWEVYAWKYRELEHIHLTRLTSVHNCAGVAAYDSKIPNTQRWLLRIVPTLKYVTKETTVQEIVDAVSIAFHHTINSKAAYRVRTELIQNRKEHQLQQYERIPQYIQRLKSANHNLYYNLATTLDDEGI